jgi:hypothetical protein
MPVIAYISDRFCLLYALLITCRYIKYSSFTDDITLTPTFIMGVFGLRNHFIQNDVVIYNGLADQVFLACIILIDLICVIKLQNWYCYAKMVAEKTAMEEASKRGIQLLIVVPPGTIGRMLQPTLNLSLSIVATYMKGTKKAYSNAVGAYVDVRDVALAHILVFEDVSTHGRYLCIGHMLHQSEFLQMMRDLFPQYPITTK